MEYRKNQTVIVTIEDIGMNGEGIGRADGYTLFVKDAIVGDEVEASLTKVKKTYAYARLVKILKPSKDRILPPCAISRQCGGCQLQALSYEAQLIFKQNKVRNDLIRIGGIDADHLDRIMERIVPAERAFVPEQYAAETHVLSAGFRYRNKAQYPVGTDKDGNPVAGFFAARTHAIIKTDDCLLGPAINKRIVDTILAHMKKYGIAAYDENSGTGTVRHIMIRTGLFSAQIMVCMVINGRSLKGADALVDELKQIPGMTSIFLNVQQDRTNVIMGKENVLLWGQETIEDTIHVCNVRDFSRTDETLTYAISPLSFYQVNPVQTERMYSQALHYADLHGTETVWDLYCGIGTISLFMARHAKRVIGVEIVEPAVEDARKNADRNGINNASFYTGKAEEVLPAFYRDHEADDLSHPDVIVVDPPRKGCDEKCLETMVMMKPEKIVYVSCDPATLARDIKYLTERGYVLSKVRPFDNFPQTVHVETCVLLGRESGRDVKYEYIDYIPKDNPLEKKRARYSDIKAWVEENYGFKVSSLYIGQVKDMCGLAKERDLKNYGKNRVPQCPEEKVEAIKAAFRYFGMIE